MKTNSPALSFEEIRGILEKLAGRDEQAKREVQEIREIQKETSFKMQETDKKMKETDRKMQETAHFLEKSKQETDRKIKENDRLIQKIEGQFGNQWGELIEALIEGSLIQILNEKNIKVNRTVPNYKGRFEGKTKEFDVIALNGNEIVVIETKSHLSQKKVDEFVKVMQVFKKYCPEYKALKVYGGMACLKARDSVFLYAEKKGLFVIHVSGKNAILMNKESFQPKALA